MKRPSSIAGLRRLAIALVGALVAGCGSEPPAASRAADPVGPPPRTERQKKAAAFERDLKSKTLHD